MIKTAQHGGKNVHPESKRLGARSKTTVRQPKSGAGNARLGRGKSKTKSLEPGRRDQPQRKGEGGKVKKRKRGD